MLQPLTQQGVRDKSRLLTTHHPQGWLISHGERSVQPSQYGQQVERWTTQLDTPHGPQRIDVNQWPQYRYMAQHKPGLLQTYGYNNVAQLAGNHSLVPPGSNVLFTVCDNTHTASVRLPLQTSKLHQQGTNHYTNNAKATQAWHIEPWHKWFSHQFYQFRPDGRIRGL
jgi:hypothetical protein